MVVSRRANYLVEDWRREFTAKKLPAAESPPITHAHHMVLTLHGKRATYRVRCTCQAGTRKTPSLRFFGYDYLLQGTSDECVRAYHEHVLGCET